MRAKPRAKVSRIVRATGLVVEVALAAPPVDGAANEELVAVLAAALSLPRKGVRLALGGTSRNKVVDVLGLTEDEVIRRLAQAAVP